MGVAKTFWIALTTRTFGPTFTEIASAFLLTDYLSSVDTLSVSNRQRGDRLDCWLEAVGSLELVFVVPSLLIVLRVLRGVRLPSPLYVAC